MFSALDKTPRVPGNCKTCRDLRTAVAALITWRMHFEQDDQLARVRELRGIFARKRGWLSLRGRGGRRKQSDRIVGHRTGAGRPPASVDAWPADLAVQTTLGFLGHLPEGWRREEHLHANGVGALWDLIGGGPATINTARGVAAYFYGVSDRTLRRNLTRERIDESRERAGLRVAALEALNQMDDEVIGNVRRTGVTIASDRYRLRLTAFAAPPRSPEAASA